MELEPANRDQIPMDTIHLSPRELYMMISSVERQIVMRLNMEKEIRVQGGQELARRLNELNHAHEQAKAKEAEFLLRAEYNLQHSELERRVEVNGTTLVSLNYLPGRIDGLLNWREDIAKLIAAFSGLPAQIESVRVKTEQQDRRLAELDKKIVSVYSYGFGASGALVVVGALINIAIHFIFKTSG